MTSEFDTFNQMSSQRYSTPESVRNDAGYILLFGMTGAGKSTFISRLTGKNPQEVGVGHGLASSTVETACYKAQYDEHHTVNLIDTPGFDDTTRPNAEILRPIADCLAALQREGKPLLGIICLQRITDVRLSGSAVRTFEVLRRVCGVDNYSRIVLATTMWDDLDEARKQDALVRESRLREYWGGMFNQQSEVIFPHDGETAEDAARRAVGLLLKRPSVDGYYPPLLIQYEMVVKEKAVEETDAGRYIRGELMLARQKRLAELQEAVDKVKRDADGLRQRQQQQQQQQAEDTWSQSVLALARPSLSVFQSSKSKRSCLPSASSVGAYSTHDRDDGPDTDTVRGEVVEPRSAVSRIWLGAGGLFGSVINWFNSDTDRSENGDGRDARPPTRSRARSFLGK